MAFLSYHGEEFLDHGMHFNGNNIYGESTNVYAGRLLLRQACAVKDDGGRWYRWWFVLAVGFHFLSIDEVIRFHEYVNGSLERAGGTPTEPWEHFPRHQRLDDE